MAGSDTGRGGRETGTGGRPSRTDRPARSAIVDRTEWLNPSMVRVIFSGPDLAELPELTYTDHYVKILFPPAGADYRWPFDVEAIRASRPPELWPTTRTYTIRWFDRARNELAIDFVVHGDEGLAGPWAAAARPGDELGFRGPGGAYAPDPEAKSHLLIGDEAAIPAIAAALDQLPDEVPAQVFLEVEDVEAEFDIARPATGGRARAAVLHWVHRDGRPYGEALVEAVCGAELPAGRLQAFAHGNAEMIRQLRPHLLRERGLERDQVSISGYWRTGHTEDRWQATKRDFNQAMETDLAADTEASR